MTGIVFLLLLLALGPLALLFGADSRSVDERDQRSWWPGAQRDTWHGSGSTSA